MFKYAMSNEVLEKYLKIFFRCIAPILFNYGLLTHRIENFVKIMTSERTKRRRVKEELESL